MVSVNLDHLRYKKNVILQELLKTIQVIIILGQQKTGDWRKDKILMCIKITFEYQWQIQQ